MECIIHLAYVCDMTDKLFMQRALDLAKNGQGRVSPNPMVGCVIVYQDRIIGEGWHNNYGEAHAEVNAVNSVKDKNLLPEAIFYITLEPCSFFGKTPACTDLIIKYSPKKVVIATTDPNPKVSGSGISALKEANIDVEVGLLESEAITINKRFFINFALKRPYVLLKWAQTADGFVAKSDFDSKWISNEHSRELVHKWRTQEDAILVGFNTAKYDNPKLTARNWPGKNPTRVIIDLKLELENSLKLFNSTEKVYVFNEVENSSSGNILRVKLESGDFIPTMLSFLLKEGIGSIIIEGGSKTIDLFISSDNWDEAMVFTSTGIFGDGIAAPILKLEKSFEQNILGDRLNITFNKKTEKHWQKK